MKLHICSEVCLDDFCLEKDQQIAQAIFIFADCLFHVLKVINRLGIDEFGCKFFIASCLTQVYDVSIRVVMAPSR